MSYQIVQSPTSIGDIFGVLAQELTTNGYTVERTSEVVGAETCISWTDGSGLWFHVDYDGSEGFSSISIGYVVGVLGRLQVGAETCTIKDLNAHAEYFIKLNVPTLIVVTEDIIYIKQISDNHYNFSIQFSKSFFYSKGTQWCVTCGTCCEFAGWTAHDYISEFLGQTYAGPFIVNSNIVYFDGTNIIKLIGLVYSDMAKNTGGNPYPRIGIKDNWNDKLLVSEYYSTLAKPLRLYIGGKPFAKLNDRIVIGRGDNLLDNQIVQIAGNNYIKTYQPTEDTSSGDYGSAYLQQATLIRYD